MANDSRAINDIYRNGLNAAYGELPRSQNRLPKTRQTSSNSAPDDGSMENGLDEPEIRFVESLVNGDEVVTDQHTGLMWHVATAFSYGPLSYANAVLAVDDLCTLKYAGFDDWYMPNLIEAISIVDWEFGYLDWRVDPMMDVMDAWTCTFDPNLMSANYTAGASGIVTFNRTETNMVGWLACRKI